MSHSRPEARGVGCVLPLGSATRNVSCIVICLEFLELYFAHFLLVMLGQETPRHCQYYAATFGDSSAPHDLTD